MKIQSIVFAGVVGVALGFGPTTSHAQTATSAGPHQAASGLQRRIQPGEFNVLTIVLDDLGTDKLAVYADDLGPPANCMATQLDSVRTPGLDSLRADGVLFTRCFVEPTCSPTRTAFLTGRYASRTGVGIAIESTHTHALQANVEPCLPRVLSTLNPAGYASAAFGKWHMSLAGDSCHPIEAGFASFEGHLDNPESHYKWKKVSAATSGGSCSWSELPVETSSLLAPSESIWDASVTRKAAADWINGLTPTSPTPGQPFYAYVAFSPPHAPQDVPPYGSMSSGTCARLANRDLDAGPTNPDVTLSMPVRRLIHHAMIEAVDYQITLLLQEIAAVLPNTMVIIVGDNGSVGDMLDNPGYSGHAKRTPFDLGTRVPLIVSGPLIAPQAQGGTNRNVVSSVDMWRTIANITGVTNSALDAYMSSLGLVSDSSSFLAGILEPATSPVRLLAHADQFVNQPPPITIGQRQRAVTNGSYRYIRYMTGTTYTPGTDERLFATTGDPCELDDLLHDTDGETPADTALALPLRTAMNAL